MKVRAVPTPLSPNLANVALNGLEQAILGHFTCRQRKAMKLNVVRYADGTPVQA
jgi:hypothetical protein